MRPPSKATLRKYGLSLERWKWLAKSCNGKCPLCLRKVPRLVIDHEHIKGWRKMPAELRETYIRGLACVRCNWQFLRRGLTSGIARRIADYLTAYDGGTK